MADFWVVRIFGLVGICVVGWGEGWWAAFVARRLHGK